MRSRMLKIAPSLLSADFKQLDQEIQAVHQAGAELLHLDVMDGHFAPAITFGPPLIASLNKPAGMEFDAHLMVQNPERVIESFFGIGLDRISIHVESTIHLHRLLKLISEQNILPAVALNPSTPLESLEWVLDDVGMVLLMTVNPGFSGQSFISTVAPKVERLKERIAQRGLSVEIQVDGGVSAKTARSLVDAGMDIAVAGSAVYGQTDYAAAIRALKEA